jgi:hypothetical protein
MVTTYTRGCTVKKTDEVHPDPVFMRFVVALICLLWGTIEIINTGIVSWNPGTWTSFPPSISLSANAAYTLTWAQAGAAREFSNKIMLFWIYRSKGQNCCHKNASRWALLSGCFVTTRVTSVIARTWLPSVNRTLYYCTRVTLVLR